MRFALIAGLLYCMVTPVQAAGQEHKFYGRDGSFQGSARPQGSDLRYYDRQGSYTGEMRPCGGGNSCFYDRQGLYRGRAQ